MRVEEAEDPRADFETMQKGFLAFSSDSTACKSVDAGHLTPQHLSASDQPILVAASATSRQHMGLKLPSGSRLKPLELIQHLGFSADVRPSHDDGPSVCPANSEVHMIIEYTSTPQYTQTQSAAPDVICTPAPLSHVSGAVIHMAL